MGGTGPVLAEACRESRKALPGWTSELTLTDLVPGWTSEQNNDLTNHKQTQSCHQQSKIDEFLHVFTFCRLKKIFYCRYLVFNERENNKQQHEINRSFIKTL